MLNIIRYPLDGELQLIEDDWQLIAKDSTHLPLNGRCLVPFSYWAENINHHDLQKKALSGELGVWFSSDDDLPLHKETILFGLKIWTVVAVDFPIFRDGRGFSMAAILRDRYGWNGQLRAIGDVLIDQLLQMSKVGFDEFVLRQDQSVTVALDQFQIYSHRLQNDWRSNRAQLGGVKS